jgi:hypothetical protein
MPHYRVYALEGRANRSFCFLEFQAADNEAAEEFARQRQMTDTLEIWRDNQRIARLEPIG